MKRAFEVERSLLDLKKQTSENVVDTTFNLSFSQSIV